LYGTTLKSLVEAWAWSADDRIYHALPLHHIHGVVNAWMCAHAVGAVVEFDERGFAAERFWGRLLASSASASASASPPPPITVFMGVPTMYVLALRHVDEVAGVETEKETAAHRAFRDAAAALRLAVSGSAACPTSVMYRWEDLVGDARKGLLERYGMTEIGMALSNPLEPTERLIGCVGNALPGVVVKLAPLPEFEEDETEESEDSDGYPAPPREARLRLRRSPAVRPRRRRGARRSSRTFHSRRSFLSGHYPSLSLINLDTPRRLSTPSDAASQRHPDVCRLVWTNTLIREACRARSGNTANCA